MDSDDNYEPYNVPLEKNSHVPSSSDDRDEGDAVGDQNQEGSSDDMINLYTCDYSQFATHMSK